MARLWDDIDGIDAATMIVLREAGHLAAQWATKAARANLPAKEDDSHSALIWAPETQSMLSQPIAISEVHLRVGLSFPDFALSFAVNDSAPETLSLAGKEISTVDAWLDDQLIQHGLSPSSAIELPYALPWADDQTLAVLPSPPGANLTPLADWFDRATDVIAHIKDEIEKLPSPSPPITLCWPHHFDIAALFLLEAGDPEHTKSINIGLSPGDETYGEPYFYVSPWPYANIDDAPPLTVGHWKSDSFAAAIATRQEIASVADRRKGVLDFLRTSVAFWRAKLGA
jgi:hypothetical protein